ncbi:MAG: class I SAM-dependent methyltransferase [Spirochaetota bacterium]
MDHPHLRIIGMDIAEEMITIASNNAASIGYNNRVTFRRGDVTKLPFEDHAVDFVVSTLSLHHWSDPTQALREIYRILKPSGQFLIFDLRRDARRFLYSNNH